MILLCNPDIICNKNVWAISRFAEWVADFSLNKSFFQMITVSHFFEFISESFCFTDFTTFQSIRCKSFGTEEINFVLFVMCNERESNLYYDNFTRTYMFQDFLEPGSTIKIRFNKAGES